MVEPISSLMIPYAVSTLASSANNYASGHFNRQEARTARYENFAFQQGLENERQQMQIAQMKLSVLQRQEDRAFQDRLAKENREFQREIEEFRQSVNLAIHQSNINFQTWRLEREKELQLEILHLNQVFQRELNLNQHQNVLTQIEKRYELERENPLFLLASRLLKSSFSNGIMPLEILLSPPELDYDVNKPQGSKLRIESFLAEEIRQFLKQGYDINDRERPTELLDKAWSSKKFGGGSAIRYLHDELKSVPVLVLESEFVNENINLRLSYWDGEYWEGESSYREEVSILSCFSYRDFLLDSAKSRAIEWRKTKAELLESGLDEATIQTLATGNNEENLAILEREEQIIATVKAAGKETNKLNIGKNYKISNEDWDAFYNYLAFLHCLAIGSIADIFALQRSYELQPLLPKLLPGLLDKLNTNAETNRESIKPVVKLYRDFYQAIEEQTEFSSLVPNLTLDFALDLADLSDKSFAVGEANYSVAVWLKLHEVEPNKIFDFNSDEDCQLLKSIIYQEDEVYLTKLQQLVEEVGDTADSLAQIKSLLAGWQSLKRWGDGIRSLSDLEEAEVETNEEPEENEKSDLELSIFSFETAFIEEIETNYSRKIRVVLETKQSSYFKEDVPKDLELEMVAIPKGKFDWFPKSSKNVNFFEHPSSNIEIEIESFYIGKYPITHKQWRVVSSLPKVNDYLLPSPDCCGQENFPVTNISWYEAIEFCLRLSKITGKNYFLPSETQWEYACKAGINTNIDFHFEKKPDGNGYRGDMLCRTASQSFNRADGTSSVGSYL